jgi:hypothetical protein
MEGGAVMAELKNPFDVEMLVNHLMPVVKNQFSKHGCWGDYDSSHYTEYDAIIQYINSLNNVELIGLLHDAGEELSK